jgi:hypothetical protein
MNLKRVNLVNWLFAPMAPSNSYKPFRYPFEVLANNNLGMANTVLLY